jgi:hypothetical protein
MKKLLASIYLSVLSAASVVAQDAIKVDRVDFNSLRDDWIQVQVELTCMGNSSPDARDSRFVEGIQLRVYLAWERDAEARQYDYYTSEVDIVIMEQGDDNNVYFYLPGLIVKRDRLRTDPDFYYVEVSINGEAQPPHKNAMSSNIANLEILKSFTSKANAEGLENENLLMPIYLVSGIDLGRVTDLPIFLRRDVRQ